MIRGAIAGRALLAAVALAASIAPHPALPAETPQCEVAVPRFGTGSCSTTWHEETEYEASGGWLRIRIADDPDMPVPWAVAGASVGGFYPLPEKIVATAKWSTSDGHVLQAHYCWLIAREVVGHTMGCDLAIPPHPMTHPGEQTLRLDVHDGGLCTRDPCLWQVSLTISRR